MRIRSTIGTVAAVAALGVAGAVTLPHVSTTPVTNTADETSSVPAAPPEALATADAISTAATLSEALQRDLGMTPEQFVAQADTAAQLGAKAGDWSKAFRESFGGVWLNQIGQGVVGVATVFPDTADGKTDPATANELRDAAKAAGFQVKDVALSQSELSDRLNQVNAIIDGLPEEQKAVVKTVEADPNQGQVVVTTDGGTESQIGNVTAALHGLAKITSLNAPSPANDTSPLGSLGDKKDQAGGVQQGSQDSDPTTGALEGLGQTGNGEGTAPEATAPTAPTTPAEPGTADPANPLGSLASLVSPEAMGTLTQLLGLTNNAEDPNANPFGSLKGFVPLPDADPAPAAPETSVAPGAKAATSGGPVIGGTAYESNIVAAKLECSTGFNGTLGGAPVVITAAHCNRLDGVRAALTDGTEFGTFAETMRDGVDSALIKVDAAQANRFANNLVGGENGAQQPITGTSDPVVGQVACKMGSRTGYSCGKIAQTGAHIDVAGQRTIDNAFTIDLCALPGDSGGVVFSGDKALGISSASNVAGEQDCGSAAAHAGAAGVTPSLSVVPITDVLAAHPGLELTTK